MVKWKNRYELLKVEYDKTLIELMELTRKYNSLLDEFKRRGEELMKYEYDYLKLSQRLKDQLDTNHQLRRTLDLRGGHQGKYESLE